jgi:hypothetical protein
MTFQVKVNIMMKIKWMLTPRLLMTTNSIAVANSTNNVPLVSYDDNLTPPLGTPDTLVGSSNATSHQNQMYQELLNANAKLLEENNNMSIHVQQIMQELKDLKERVPLSA